ncbi:GRRM system radical SAM/SPASM domain protein [Mesorhizobium sp. B292B1B]|uniref:cyclophane-forming radical SAM/SPASM peptide maturase GrrM/OscB n=1 Tax=unclassified Mesorhizobium TaxID=325217 RepID=UPI00112A3CFC|nr:MULTISPECIES: cyclophane-forming radical SAM/SPASM peptide maturase GrrM/OscB [unclassified Mesorhizobium]MCA0012892.1 GRRM system radical SAM/SPASM domain protein [Mesorhizobium sp. B294B1A1]MCA0037607.1 GRRM system radical SAM/SPASM domain protein [Mesorhizobium sp. B292B1B]TPM50712.1 GRRM system radical SAM/SPASM domain protein [Mesorhizobium sp. B2-3-2]
MWNPRLIILQPTAYCNISCTYCYLSHRNDRTLMSAEILEAIREKVFARLPPDAAAGIVWHAGEPTAAPIQWFERAYACLEPKRPANCNFAMQSNGIAIDARWIDLFRRTRTEISLSIDGPERFHDARRLTRSGKPTWRLAMRGLKRLQDAGFEPRVITVLHPDCLRCAQEFFEFYRDNGIKDVSFSVDELEGANKSSSFDGCDYKPEIVRFLLSILTLAYRSGYALYIREVERIASILGGAPFVGNELNEPWAALVIGANGNVSTFSPEFMEVRAPEYKNFVFGNILTDDLEVIKRSSFLNRVEKEILKGVDACRVSCRYFGVCGGGSPVNKYCESRNLASTETEFCRLTIQASTDALIGFLANQSSNADSFASATVGA